MAYYAGEDTAQQTVLIARGGAAAGPAWTGYVVFSNSADQDSASVDYWITDEQYYASIMTSPDDTTNTSAGWGFSGIDFALSSYETNDGVPIDLTVTSAGWRYKNLPLFSFGPSDSLSGATVDSAKLNICIANANADDVDSLFVWACTEGDWQNWANDNSDVSWAYYDASLSERWSPSLGLMTEGDIGEYVGFDATDVSGTQLTYMVFDVKSLVQAHIDAETKFVFTIFIQGTTAGSYIRLFNQTHDAEYRPFLEVWASE